MAEEVAPKQIEALAAMSRVPLRPGTAERIAAAVTYPLTRFAAEKVALPMEVEPFTYLVVAGKELR